MLIEKLNIKEFRGIKECEKPLEFSKFNVLIGRNNSGKSTILEALSLLPYINTIDLVQGLKRIDVLKIEHHEDKYKKAYKGLLYLHAGTSFLEYYLPYGTLVIEINEDKIEMGAKRKKVIKETEYAQFFNVQPNLLENLVLYIPMHTDIVKKIEKEVKEHKDLIMKKGYHMEVAKMLNKSVDDKYSDIAFLEPISIRKELPNNFVYLPLKDLGSGAEKFVSLVSFIEVIKPKLLLIDDFESGFHPSLIRSFLKWLKKKNIQVVLSTHSIDVLDGLVEVRPESTRVILLRKNEGDILKHKTFSLQKLQDFLNANTDPRYLIDQLNL
jgi:predicted ATP-dependent endonuclease of OLD family